MLMVHVWEVVNRLVSGAQYVLRNGANLKLKKVG